MMMKPVEAEALICEAFESGWLRPISNDLIAYIDDRMCGCAVAALALKMGFEPDAIFHAVEEGVTPDFFDDIAKRMKVKPQALWDLVDGFDGTGASQHPAGVYNRQREREFFQLGCRLRERWAPKRWGQP